MRYSDPTDTFIIQNKEQFFSLEVICSRLFLVAEHLQKQDSLYVIHFFKMNEAAFMVLKEHVIKCNAVVYWCIF